VNGLDALVHFNALSFCHEYAPSILADNPP